MTNMKKVRDVVGDDEMRELLQRRQDAAHARDTLFIFDESRQVMSDRQHAAYLRTLAESVGMLKLAERLNPSEFAPGMFERVMNDGRNRKQSAHLAVTHEPDRQTRTSES